VKHALIWDAIRTPFGRYGGALAGLRTDDLAAIPIRALLERNPQLDPAAIGDVVYGCANQAGRTIAMLRAWRSCWRAFRKRYRGPR
jgi:acetyl-CoA acetyltransferase